MLPAQHSTARGSLTVSVGALEATLIGFLRCFRNVALSTFGSDNYPTTTVALSTFGSDNYPTTTVKIDNKYNVEWQRATL